LAKPRLKSRRTPPPIFSSDEIPRNPIVGTADLWAFATAVHAAAPPSPAMKSRRFVLLVGIRFLTVAPNHSTGHHEHLADGMVKS
jgi:hypothetical protein